MQAVITYNSTILPNYLIIFFLINVLFWWAIWHKNCFREDSCAARKKEYRRPTMKREEVATILSIGSGSTAGGASAILGVMAGAGEGLAGAAALTHGLAVVGSIVGGGMLAGLFVVAASPMAGGAFGYGTYRLYK
jgi:hypothetical protein